MMATRLNGLIQAFVVICASVLVILFSGSASCVLQSDDQDHDDRQGIVLLKEPTIDRR